MAVPSIVIKDILTFLDYWKSHVINVLWDVVQVDDWHHHHDEERRVEECRVIIFPSNEVSLDFETPVNESFRLRELTEWDDVVNTTDASPVVNGIRIRSALGLGTNYALLGHTAASDKTRLAINHRTRWLTLFPLPITPDDFQALPIHNNQPKVNLGQLAAEANRLLSSLDLIHCSGNDGHHPGAWRICKVAQEVCNDHLASGPACGAPPRPSWRQIEERYKKLPCEVFREFSTRSEGLDGRTHPDAGEYFTAEMTAQTKALRQRDQMRRWVEQVDTGKVRGWTVESVSLDCSGWDDAFGLPTAIAKDVRRIRQLFLARRSGGRNPDIPHSFLYSEDMAKQRLEAYRNSSKLHFIRVEDSEEDEESSERMEVQNTSEGSESQKSVPPAKKMRRLLVPTDSEQESGADDDGSTKSCTTTAATTTTTTTTSNDLPQAHTSIPNSIERSYTYRVLVGHISAEHACELEKFKKLSPFVLGKALWWIFSFGSSAPNENLLAQHAPTIMWNLALLGGYFVESISRCLSSYQSAAGNVEELAVARQPIENFTQAIRSGGKVRSLRMSAVRRITTDSSSSSVRKPQSSVENADEVHAIAASQPPDGVKSSPGPGEAKTEGQLLLEREAQRAQENTRRMQLEQLERVDLFYKKDRAYRTFVPTWSRPCRCARCTRNFTKIPNDDHLIIADSSDHLVTPDVIELINAQAALEASKASDVGGITCGRRYHHSSNNGGKNKHKEEVDMAGDYTAERLLASYSELTRALLLLPPDRRDEICQQRRSMIAHPTVYLQVLLEQFERLGLDIATLQDHHQFLRGLLLQNANEVPLDLSDASPQSNENNPPKLPISLTTSSPSTTDENRCPPRRHRRQGQIVVDGNEESLWDQVFDKDNFQIRCISKLSLSHRRKLLTLCADRNASPPVLIGSNDKGRAVYAAKIIYKGDFVCEYRGGFFSQYGMAKIKEEEHRNAGLGSYMFFFVNPLTALVNCIDATLEEYRFGWARLINHSHRHPNLEIEVIPSFSDDKPSRKSARLIFSAARDIFIGEELLIDYGETNRNVIEANPWLKN